MKRTVIINVGPCGHTVDLHFVGECTVEMGRRYIERVEDSETVYEFPRAVGSITQLISASTSDGVRARYQAKLELVPTLP